MKPAAWLTGALGLVLAAEGALQSQGAAMTQRAFDVLPFAPRQYVCLRTPATLDVDGRLTERAWQAAPWTDPFVDIEGGARPAPRFRTRVKMLWDDEYFYVAAEMEDPDVWATLTERDAVIFNDNDFEIFIDPDGDTHNYGELEINPLGTVWDLLLVRPYRDGGPAVTAWDIAGLKSGVETRGTLNRPGDKDEGWTAEIAMPWRILRELARGKRPPQRGEQWRVNFSRVAWQADAHDGRYVKRLDPATGKPLAADNWVWSPQGVVDMHMPERWGYVQFAGAVAGSGDEAFVEDRDRSVAWALRRLYYRQRQFRAANGRFADILAALGLETMGADGLPFVPSLQASADFYQISAKGPSGATLHIRHDGRAWKD